MWKGGNLMKGKEKCKALKEIRRQIAEKNDIPFAPDYYRYGSKKKIYGKIKNFAKLS